MGLTGSNSGTSSSWTKGEKKYSNPWSSVNSGGSSPKPSSSPAGGSASNSASTTSNTHSFTPKPPAAPLQSNSPISGNTPGIIYALNRNGPLTPGAPMSDNRVVQSFTGAGYVDRGGSSGGSSGHASYNRKVPSPSTGQNGMTRVLNERGAIQPQNSFVRDEPSYTPAYGYSTKEGTVTYSYGPQRPVPAETRTTQQRFYAGQRDAKMLLMANPAFAAINKADELSGGKVSYLIGAGLAPNENRSLYQNPVSRKPQVFDNGFTSPQFGNLRYVPQNLARGAADIPNTVYRNPLGSLNTIQMSAISGGVGGSIAGGFVARTAASSVPRAALVDSAITYGGYGMLGAGVAAYPEETGKNLPSIIAGGGTFISGYRGSVPPNTVRFSGFSGTSGTMRGSKDTLGGFGDGKVRSTITEYGQARQQDVPVSYIVSGSRAESGRFVVDLQSIGEVKVGKKTVPFQNDYVGTINPRTGVMQLTDKKGTYFSSGVGKVRDGPNPWRKTSYAVMKNNKYGIPVVTETGTGAQGIDSVAYLRFKPRSYKSENIDIFQMGNPKALTFEQTGGVTSGRPNGGTTKRLFSGFSDMQRSGYYEQADTSVWRPESLGRKGTLRYMESSQDSITRPFEYGKLRGGGRRGVSVEGLPFRDVALPTRTPLFGGALGNSTSQRQKPFFIQSNPFKRANSFDTIPKPRTDMYPASRTNIIPGITTDIIPQQTTIPTTTTKTPGRMITPSIRIPQPPIFPPAALPLPGLAVPPGRGFGDSGSKGRGFMYEADLTSSLLGVKGKKKKGLLSGLEWRPVAR